MYCLYYTRLFWGKIEDFVAEFVFFVLKIGLGGIEAHFAWHKILFICRTCGDDVEISTLFIIHQTAPHRAFPFQNQSYKKTKPKNVKS